MNVFTCMCLWLLVKLMWALWAALVKHICLVPIISDTFTFLEVTIQELFCDMLVYCFSRSFRTKKPFIYDIFWKIKWFLKHDWDFTVCLGFMLLLTHGAVFTNCSWWCGWAYADLHYIYILVLLNWSSLKSIPAGIENLQCSYNQVSLFYFIFSSSFPLCYSVLRQTDSPGHATSWSFLQFFSPLT